MDDDPQLLSVGPLPPGSRAFTLVELMIVVALLGLLAGISVISLNTEDNRISELNRDVANRIQEARSHAMTTGEVVYMDIDPDDEEGALTFSVALEESGGDLATSCALAEATGDQLAEIHVNQYGVPVELMEVDPDQSGPYCIGPGGRITGEHGEELGVTQRGCTESEVGEQEQMNLLLIFADPDADPDFGELTECEPDDETQQAQNRDLANFSMIHAGYGGQVRIIR